MHQTVGSGRGNALQNILIALIAGAVLAGCAEVPTGEMALPSVTISGFGAGDSSLFEQQFNLKLRIQNPNPVDLRIDGNAFDLEINGEPFATGVGNQALTVPRFDSGFMPVEAVSSLGGLLRQFGRIVHGGSPAFKYRIKGSLSMAGGMRVPFDRSGEFDLRAIAPK